MVARPSSRRPRPRRRASRTCALALAPALALAACGGQPDGSEDPIPAQEAGPRGNAKATVKTWLTACAKEEGTVVVEILPTPARSAIYSSPSVLEGCEGVADLVPDSAPDPTREELKKVFEEAKVEDVRVGAGYGTATVHSPLGTTSEVELERARGAWTLSNPPLLPR